MHGCVLSCQVVPGSLRPLCILKEISPGYSLEGLMLKLKLQYFGHHAGRDWGREEKGKTSQSIGSFSFNISPSNE